MRTTIQTLRFPLAAFLSASVLLLIQAWYYYPKMPERVASHFDITGKADAWMAKSKFLAFEIGIFCLVGGVFLAVSLLLPKLPADLINIPRKDYWLAEERRSETFAYLGRTSLWFGVLSVLALATLFQLVYRVNLNAGTELPPAFHYFFGAYLLGVLSLLIRFFIYFSKPPKPSP